MEGNVRNEIYLEMGRERESGERESRPEKIYMRTIGAHAKIRYFK